MINYAVSTDDNDKLSFLCVMRRPKTKTCIYVTKRHTYASFQI